MDFCFQIFKDFHVQPPLTLSRLQLINIATGIFKKMHICQLVDAFRAIPSTLLVYMFLRFFSSSAAAGKL